MKQYSVVTQNDKWFKGKFNTQKLETLLNDYAKQGWVVKQITTADINSGLGQSRRQEIIIVFEADA